MPDINTTVRLNIRKRVTQGNALRDETPNTERIAKDQNVNAISCECAT
jgi:hypothetical protein